MKVLRLTKRAASPYTVVVLLCLTANHHDTDFEVLDRVARLADDAVTARFARDERVRGAVVLATCNRFEAYLDVVDELDDPRALLRAALPAAAPADADALAAGVVVLPGDAGVRHLFAVASGMKSMVVGEGEIAGQVQRALTAARAEGLTTPELERAFQRATSASRAVRARMDLAGSGRTLVRTVLDMLESRVIDWARPRILIVGTGSYAATTIATLRARGAADISVFSATGRAAMFAAKYGVHAEDDLASAISRAELVITCTARYTVTASDVPADGTARIIVDLGLPRNVDPAVADVPGVELVDLELIGTHAALPELAASVHHLVGVYADAYLADREAAPAVVAWREHVQRLLETETARLGDRADDERTRAALRHFAGMLAHGPSVRAREYAAAGKLDEYIRALETVFGPALVTDAALPG